MNFLKISFTFFIIFYSYWITLFSMKQDENIYNSPTNEEKLALQYLINTYGPNKAITRCSYYFYAIQIISYYGQKLIHLNSKEFIEIPLDKLVSIMIVSHDFDIIELRNKCIDIFIQKIKGLEKNNDTIPPKIIKEIPQSLKDVCINHSYNTFEAHTSWVNIITMTSDGNTIVSSSEKNEINVFDSTSYKCLKKFKGQYPLVLVDSETEIFYIDDKKIQHINLKSQIYSTLTTNHFDIISAFALIDSNKNSHLLIFESYDPNSPPSFQKDKIILATGSYDSTIEILDFYSKKCLQVFKGHKGTIYALTGLPDKKRVLSASQDTTIKLWKIDSDECIKTYEGHTNSVTCIALAPTTMKFISGSSDQTIRIWDVETGECERKIDVLLGTIMSLITTQDETSMISGSYEGMIHIFDIKSGTCIKKCESSPCLRALTLSPDERKIISTSHKAIRVYDLYLFFLFGK